MKPATIKDIAAKLKLHHSTVSRALRNHPDISHETKQLVVNAADLLNYRPNPIAQNLRGKRQLSIAVEVPDLAMSSCQEFVSTIAANCTDLEIPLQLIVQSEEDQTRTQKLAIAAGVHGLIIWQRCIPHTACAPEFRSCSPLYVGGRTKLEMPENSVSCSWYTCTEILVNRLAMAGKRRIGIVTGKDDDRSKVIVDAYKNVLLDAYLPVLSGMSLTGAVTHNDGALAAEHIMNQLEKPEIVIITEDAAAEGFIANIDSSGPEIALVGDSIPTSKIPYSATIPWQEMATKSLRLMQQIAAGNGQETSIDIQPVIREE